MSAPCSFLDLVPLTCTLGERLHASGAIETRSLKGPSHFAAGGGEPQHVLELEYVGYALSDHPKQTVISVQHLCRTQQMVQLMI